MRDIGLVLTITFLVPLVGAIGGTIVANLPGASRRGARDRAIKR